MKKIYLLISVCTIFLCLNIFAIAQPYAANYSGSNFTQTGLIAAANSLGSQDKSDSYVEIGTGLLERYETFNDYYSDHRVQFVYLQSEMAPLSAGSIPKIAFNFINYGGSTMQNFNISMAHTTNTDLSGGYVTDGLTTVYFSANFDFLGAGWQTITLTTPFNWNGTSNLVIQICHDNPDGIAGDAHYVYTSTVTNRMTNKAINSGAGCSLTGPSSRSNLPNIRIYGTLQAPLAPVLSSPLNSAVNQATRITLAWNAANYATGYRLQVATDAGFSNIVIDQADITTAGKRFTLNTNTQYFWKVNATNAGGTSDWSTAWNFTTAATPYEVDYFLFFNGTNAYVDCGNVERFNLTTAATVQAWIKLSSTANSGVIGGKLFHSDSRWGYGLFANSEGVAGVFPGKVSFTVGQSWNSMHSVLSSTTLNTGTWYHVAGTFDGQLLKIYINGVLDNTTDIGSPYTMTPPTSYPFCIGKFSAEDGRYFHGGIDELSVWNIARTASDISSTYNTILVGNEPGLIGYYKMNDGVGTTLTDEQTNFARATGTDGTIYNATWEGGDTPLPVELTSFTARVNQKNVILNWRTASESNNSGFGVQRQSAGEEWKEIAFVKGSGTSTTPVDYAYEDKNLTTGTYSYRLKQVDYNGNYEYFNLNSNVEIGAPQKYSISQNYPNPFNPTTKIYFDVPKVSSVKISVYDVSGREVKVLVNDKYQPGNYEAVFDGSMYSSGVYFYKIRAGDFTKTMKMILLK